MAFAIGKICITYLGLLIVFKVKKNIRCFGTKIPESSSCASTRFLSVRAEAELLLCV